MSHVDLHGPGGLRKENTSVPGVHKPLGTKMGLREEKIQLLDFNVERQAGRQACPGLIELTGLRSEGQRVATTFGACYLSPSQLTFPLTSPTSKLIIYLPEIQLGYVRWK